MEIVEDSYGAWVGTLVFFLSVRSNEQLGCKKLEEVIYGNYRGHVSSYCALCLFFYVWLKLLFLSLIAGYVILGIETFLFEFCYFQTKNTSEIQSFLSLDGCLMMTALLLAV